MEEAEVRRMLKEAFERMDPELEFEGDKIIRETRYYAEPFEPPEWRARWSES